MEQFLNQYSQRLNRGREYSTISKLRERSISQHRVEAKEKEQEVTPQPAEVKPAENIEKVASRPSTKQKPPASKKVENDDDKVKKARDKLIMSLTSSTKRQKDKLNKITEQLQKTGFDSEKLDNKIREKKKKISLLKQSKLLADDEILKEQLISNDIIKDCDNKKEDASPEIE